MNYYLIILTLVSLGGIGIALWGWQILRSAQKIRAWPSVEGVIKGSGPSSEEDDLLPHIVYGYEVDGQALRSRFEFPSGTQPLPEFAQAYVKKYPVGATVQVFYNPEQVDQSSLEPGAQGDWMILVLGILMAAGGLAALVLNTASQ